MGIFIPSCVISDGSRFYAFGRSRFYGEGTEVFLLAKSNEHPSYNLRDMTWTVVSAVATSGYPGLPNFTNMDGYACAVDSDTGAFVVFSYDVPGFVVGVPSAGLEYQPSAAPTGPSIFGGGAWKGIVLPKGYMWDDSGQSALFYHKDSAGTTTLMHAFTKPGSDMYVASLDRVSMTMIQGTAPWKWTTTPYYNEGAIAYRNNTLYLMAKYYDAPRFYGWAAFPLASSSTTPPTAPPTLYNNTVIRDSCADTFNDVYIKPLRDNDMVAACLNLNPPQIFVFNGTQYTKLPPTQDLPQNGNGPSTLIKSLEPMTGSDSVPYLFMHTITSIYSVALEGPFAGVLISGLTNITVDGQFGLPQAIPRATTSLPVPSSTGPPQSGERKSEGGVIAGICVAAVVVIAALVFVFFRRVRRLERTTTRKEDVDELKNQWLPLNEQPKPPPIPKATKPTAVRPIGTTITTTTPNAPAAPIALDNTEVKGNSPSSSSRNGTGSETTPPPHHPTTSQGIIPRWAPAPPAPSDLSELMSTHPLNYPQPVSPTTPGFGGHQGGALTTVNHLNNNNNNALAGNARIQSFGPSQWRAMGMAITSPPSISTYNSSSSWTGSGSALTEMEVAGSDVVGATNEQGTMMTMTMASNPQFGENAFWTLANAPDIGNPHTSPPPSRPGS
ncbi:hypothetical protein B0O80DRAFT_448886 [Mortierella sp. GBAus27b]|nr:hypothetical protein B0O80DRAFT_448886 [Mortierella sp. GBAus27b]